jgi:hypothetical protein
MSLTRVCVMLGVVLCAAVACGRSGEVGPPPPTPKTDASRAVADEHAIDLRPHPWTRYDVMEDNRIRIHYTITGSPQCNALGRVEVAESADTVAITLHIGRLPAVSCVAKVLKAADMFTDVQLAAALDGRSIKDGSAR